MLIEFTDDEIGRIHEYMEQAEAINTKVAILNAISIASDRLDFIDDTVVYCKDCKYNSGSCQGMYAQFVTCYKTGSPHKKDWFCADGRRRFADEDTPKQGDQDVLMPAT